MQKQKKPNLSKDYSIISSYVEPNDKVLDLGCSQGNLLAHLRKTKNVREIGVEANMQQIELCLQKKTQCLPWRYF